MKPPSDAKRERLAVALRENLKRRKARTRALDKKARPRPNTAIKTDLT
jgi:hypothetical protein